MTAIESHIDRISRAKGIEALSDIARDIEALQHAEHAPADERERLEQAVRDKATALQKLLMAG